MGMGVGGGVHCRDIAVPARSKRRRFVWLFVWMETRQARKAEDETQKKLRKNEEHKDTASQNASTGSGAAFTAGGNSGPNFIEKS